MSSQFSLGIDVDLISFESVLPADGRLQTVDVRDVAAAFVAATTVPTETANHEVLLIGGDPETHRHIQSAVGSQAAAAMGIKGGLPIGRPATPMTTRPGSRPTGWTPAARRKCSDSSTTRGRSSWQTPGPTPG